MEQSTALVALITGIWGAIQSFAFLYIPGLKDWYNSLGAGKPEGYSTSYKRLVQLVGIVIVGVVVYLAACAGSPIKGVECTQNGFWELVIALLIAISTGVGGNQLAYWGLPNKTNKRPEG